MTKAEDRGPEAGLLKGSVGFEVGPEVTLENKALCYMRWHAAAYGTRPLMARGRLWHAAAYGAPASADEIADTCGIGVRAAYDMLKDMQTRGVAQYFEGSYSRGWRAAAA